MWRCLCSSRVLELVTFESDENDGTLDGRGAIVELYRSTRARTSGEPLVSWREAWTLVYVPSCPASNMANCDA